MFLTKQIILETVLLIRLLACPASATRMLCISLCLVPSKGCPAAQLCQGCCLPIRKPEECKNNHQFLLSVKMDLFHLVQCLTLALLAQAVAQDPSFVPPVLGWEILDQEFLFAFSKIHLCIRRWDTGAQEPVCLFGLFSIFLYPL